jgi:enhancing lycopene biosynthesis protein 2
MPRKQIAVILCGCGHRDGSEIHEATLTLWAIHRNGADYRCFAPNIVQHHVVNHLTGEEMPEQRQVLIEAARIARGQIQDLASFDPAEVDALVLPGGLGAAYNLCSYALDGPNCTVHPEVEQAVRSVYQAGKPLGALCIAPMILARILGQGVLLTLGHDTSEAAAHLRAMGAQHQATGVGEVLVDPVHKVVSSPCYMLESRLDAIASGAEQVIQALLRLMPASA